MCHKQVTFPTTIPYLRPLTLIWTIISIAWISLEGHLTQVIILGVFTTIILLANLAQQFLYGRSLHLWQILIGTTLTGWIAGNLLPSLIIFLMTIKTGLHAHGIEFTPDEIIWVVQQIKLWGISGGLFGLGLGVLWISL